MTRSTEPKVRNFADTTPSNIVGPTVTALHSYLHSLRSDEHTEVVRGLAWSPVDDTLYTSGWGQQIFSHAFDNGEPSDLNVETSKSQATSVCMDIFNGDVNGNGMSQDEENGIETMEVEGPEQIQRTLPSKVQTDSAIVTAAS